MQKKKRRFTEKEKIQVGRKKEEKKIRNLKSEKPSTLVYYPINMVHVLKLYKRRILCFKVQESNLG